MTLTSRFGLSAVGGEDGGTIVDDGGKYTYEDRIALDRILAALERHQHNVLPRTPVEPEQPTATLGTQGALPPGQELYYSVALVDADGLETVGSTEVLIQTPSPVAPPGQPFVETTDGGSLPVGIYYYVLTALRGDEESTISAPITAQVIPGDTTVLVQMPAPDEGVTNFRVWRMGNSESGYTKIGLAPAREGAIFTDDGSVPADPCACDPENSPPVTVRGASVYSATITLAPTDAARARAATIAAWRLYRTNASGNYAGASLVHEVVERTGEDTTSTTAPLLTSWTDIGDPLAGGRPNLVDQSVLIQPYTFARADELPDPTPYPEGFPYVARNILYAKTDGEWTSLAPTTQQPRLAAQHLRVTSPNGTSYKLLGDLDALRVVTRQMSTARPDSAVVLLADDQVHRRIGVSNDGTVTLTQVDINDYVDTDQVVAVYNAAAPLLLPTVDPTAVLATWAQNGNLMTAEI